MKSTNILKHKHLNEIYQITKAYNDTNMMV